MAKRIVLPTLNDGVAGLSTKVEIKSKSKWRFIAQSPANSPSDSNIAEGRLPEKERRNDRRE